MKQSIYEEITGRIITMLEAGTIPWRKPWTVTAGMPRNLISKKAYRGVNVLLLHALSYESPLWATYKQVAQLGGSVRRGEKACPVIFWKPLEVADKETGETQKIPLLRYFYVFNLAQCQGLTDISAPLATPATTEAQAIIDNMPQRPDIKFGMTKAFYSPREDFVAMPNRDRFDSEAGYFATLFHELTHATGHETRLNRQTVTKQAGFGSNEYSKEELVAELGASFLCAEAAIVQHTLDNTAAYIANWLTALKNDSKLIIQASAQAQKATDFILAKKFGDAIAE
jgi:antirestriction protein ArdC